LEGRRDRVAPWREGIEDSGDRGGRERRERDDSEEKGGRQTDYTEIQRKILDLINMEQVQGFGNRGYNRQSTSAMRPMTTNGHNQPPWTTPPPPLPREILNPINTI
jgi:hypothetical protein